MKINFFCPRWGFNDIPWDSFLADVKAAGFTGIEWFPFAEKADYQEVLRLLRKHQLDFCIVMAVLQHYEKFDEIRICSQKTTAATIRHSRAITITFVYHRPNGKGILHHRAN